MILVGFKYTCINFSALFLKIKISRFNKIILALLAVVVVGINLFFVIASIDQKLPHHWAIYLGFGIGGFLYLLLVGYITLHLIESFGGNFIARIPVNFIS
jgi:hypothetical protein